MTNTTIPHNERVTHPALPSALTSSMRIATTKMASRAHNVGTILSAAFVLNNLSSMLNNLSNNTFVSSGIKSMFILMMMLLLHHSVASPLTLSTLPVSQTWASSTSASLTFSSISLVAKEGLDYV